MAEKKIIAVIGATGAQGGGLVRAIVNDPGSGFVARAVTRGEFKLPPIHAECMYDPAIWSTRGAGVVRVKAE